MTFPCAFLILGISHSAELTCTVAGPLFLHLRFSGVARAACAWPCGRRLTWAGVSSSCDVLEELGSGIRELLTTSPGMPAAQLSERLAVTCLAPVRPWIPGAPPGPSPQEEQLPEMPGNGHGSLGSAWLRARGRVLPGVTVIWGWYATLPYVLRFLWETRLWVKFGPLHPEKFHPNSLIVKISLRYSTSGQREGGKEILKQTPH